MKIEKKIATNKIKKKEKGKEKTAESSILFPFFLEQFGTYLYPLLIR